AAINYREDLLAGLGVLVPLAWLLRPCSREDSRAGALAVGAVYLLGLLGKETALVLVALVPALSLVLHQTRSAFRLRERTLASLFAALLMWASWRFALHATGADGVPQAAGAGLAVRLCGTARASVRSVAASLFPLAWSPDHAAEPPASALWVLAALTV